MRRLLKLSGFVVLVTVVRFIDYCIVAASGFDPCCPGAARAPLGQGDAAVLRCHGRGSEGGGGEVGLDGRALADDSTLLSSSASGVFVILRSFHRGLPYCRS